MGGTGKTLSAVAVRHGSREKTGNTHEAPANGDGRTSKGRSASKASTWAQHTQRSRRKPQRQHRTRSAPQHWSARKHFRSLSTTALHSLTMSFDAAFARALDDRDFREHLSIEKFLLQNNSLALANRVLLKDISSLNANLKVLQTEHSISLAALSKAELEGSVSLFPTFLICNFVPQPSSPENTLKIADLAKQVADLKDERSDFYKSQNLNAQRLLESMDTLKVRDERIRVLEAENDKLSTNAKTLTTQLGDCKALLKEKDGIIEIIRDELATLHLELSQREEQLQKASARLIVLETENAQLVDRWMQHKQDEAARMNEATEFVENALKNKQALVDAKKRESLTSPQLSSRDLLAELR
ncbi:hypothetical protein HK096_009974, partial [Nowakowskiella sp. JEL0078]